MAKRASLDPRKPLGLGFLPAEGRHGFIVTIPKGTGAEDRIQIREERSIEVDLLKSGKELAVPDADPSLRVSIDRRRWNDLAPGFWEEANRRLRANGLTTHKFTKSPLYPLPVHPSLGKELCLLCWAVEQGPREDIPNALLNWEALAPEERWWLFTMTVASSGQALQKEKGWRKALRFALAENPFLKAEIPVPKRRRELLGHNQPMLPFE